MVSPSADLRDRYRRRVEAETHDLELIARVPLDSRPVLVSQAFMCEAAGVTDQTLRNWARDGMAVYGTRSRPRYSPRQVLAWSLYKDDLATRTGRKGERFTQADADRWLMARDAGGDWGWYVVVPL